MKRNCISVTADFFSKRSQYHNSMEALHSQIYVLSFPSELKSAFAPTPQLYRLERFSIQAIVRAFRCRSAFFHPPQMFLYPRTSAANKCTKTTLVNPIYPFSRHRQYASAKRRVNSIEFFSRFAS